MRASDLALHTNPKLKAKVPIRNPRTRQSHVEQGQSRAEQRGNMPVPRFESRARVFPEPRQCHASATPVPCQCHAPKTRQSHAVPRYSHTVPLSATQCHASATLQPRPSATPVPRQCHASATPEPHHRDATQPHSHALSSQSHAEPRRYMSQPRPG